MSNNVSLEKGEYQRLNHSEPELDLSTFPTLSPAAMKLMVIIFDKEVDIDEVVTIIQKDINLSVEVIRIANSPRYRVGAEIDSVGKAIVYLGLDTIKNIVLSISVTGTMKDILPEKCFSLVLSHALATASAAQILSEYFTGVNPETAFLIGLFLDLGLFVCASLYPDEFVDLVEESNVKGIPIKMVIQEKLCIDTNELSFKIAKRWQLPNIILENINCRAEVAKKLADPSIELPPMLTLSYLSGMASNVFFGASILVNVTLFKNSFLLLLGKSNTLASEVLNLLAEDFNHTIETLGLVLQKKEGFIETLKHSNKQLLMINSTHESMYKALYEQSTLILKMTKELEKKNRIMSKLVTVDPLTTLYNRKFMVKNLERLIAESIRYKNPLSVIMMNIDFFRKPNESYGLQAGDEILVQISQCIKTVFRTSDICARYGGEEFVFLLPQTELNNALIAADKMRLKIAEHTFKIMAVKPELALNITVSLGVSGLSEHCNSVVSLLKDCDSQLIKAKEAGRNCVRPIII